MSTRRRASYAATFRGTLVTIACAAAALFVVINAWLARAIEDVGASDDGHEYLHAAARAQTPRPHAAAGTDGGDGCLPGSVRSAATGACERRYFYPFLMDDAVADPAVSPCRDLYGHACGRWLAAVGNGSDGVRHLNAFNNERPDGAIVELFNQRMARGVGNEDHDDDSAVGRFVRACVYGGGGSGGGGESEDADEWAGLAAELAKLQQHADLPKLMHALVAQQWFVPWTSERTSERWVTTVCGFHPARFVSLELLRTRPDLDGAALRWAGDVRVWFEAVLAQPRVWTALWTNATAARRRALGLCGRGDGGTNVFNVGPACDNDGPAPGGGLWRAVRKWAWWLWLGGHPPPVHSQAAAALAARFLHAAAAHDSALAAAGVCEHASVGEWVVNGVMEHRSPQRTHTRSELARLANATMDVEAWRWFATGLALLSPAVASDVVSERRRGMWTAVPRTTALPVVAVTRVALPALGRPDAGTGTDAGAGTGAGAGALRAEAWLLRPHGAFARRTDIATLEDEAPRHALFSRGHCKRLALLHMYPLLQHLYATGMSAVHVHGGGVFGTASERPAHDATQRVAECLGRSLAVEFDDGADAEFGACVSNMFGRGTSYGALEALRVAQHCGRLLEEHAPDDPFVPYVVAVHHAGDPGGGGGGDPGGTTHIHVAAALLQLPWFVDKLSPASYSGRLLAWVAEALRDVADPHETLRAALVDCFSDCTRQAMFWLELAQNWCTAPDTRCGLVPVRDASDACFGTGGVSAPERIARLVSDAAIAPLLHRALGCETTTAVLQSQ